MKRGREELWREGWAKRDGVTDEEKEAVTESH